MKDSANAFCTVACPERCSAKRLCDRSPSTRWHCWSVGAIVAHDHLGLAVCIGGCTLLHSVTAGAAGAAPRRRLPMSPASRLGARDSGASHTRPCQSSIGRLRPCSIITSNGEIAAGPATSTDEMAARRMSQAKIAAAMKTALTAAATSFAHDGSPVRLRSKQVSQSPEWPTRW
jgi:hypothetical protein